jgi:hypothetical protein
MKRRLILFLLRELALIGADDASKPRIFPGGARDSKEQGRGVSAAAL